MREMQRADYGSSIYLIDLETLEETKINLD